MPRLRIGLLASVSLLLLMSVIVVAPSHAQQDIGDLLEIEVEQAGYGGIYRPDYWIPLKVRVTNRGPDFNGRVVVRPETSDGSVDHVFSTPVNDLSRPIVPSTETSRTFFLYIIANGGDTNIRVELLNDEDRVAATTDISLSDRLSRDGIYVTVPRDNSINLSSASIGGYNAFQVGWEISDIPDRAGGLEAVDVMVFSDVDTARLTDAQRTALELWVVGGGHLIVTGGDNAAQTADGFADLLPFVPDTGSTATTEDLTELARLAGDFSESLTGETFITEGEVKAGAQVLAQDGESRPLLVRQGRGNGTIDYLTVSPSLAPLSGFDNIDGLWFSILTTTEPYPGWSNGILNWSDAKTAIEILPGLDLLPAALSLIGFLGIYILLVGPLNYFILARLNRRGYAWFTIPILIAVFSVLAWSVGFSLRGNEVTLSRIAVVQTWPEEEAARVDQLVGLLAPRRGDYTLTMSDEDRMLRPLGRLDGFAPLAATEANIRIEQTENFEAVEFPVDASFIAGFNALGFAERPDIGGSVTLSVDANGRLTLRGVVRNSSEITLNDPVILARGLVVPLGDALTTDGPDNIIDFSTESQAPPVLESAVPHPLEYDRGGGGRISAVNRARSGRSTVRVPFTADGIMQQQRAESEDGLDEEVRRREAFLSSFINDQYASSARGNRVYLIGWGDVAPFEEDVPGERIRYVETTLYVIELESETTTAPGTNTAVVGQDQFSWVSIERDDLPDIGPVNMELFDENQATFRFTPLPGAVLDEVDQLVLIVERSSTRLGGVINMWNWQTGEYEEVEFEPAERTILTDFERFLGPNNAVQVRTVPRSDGGVTLISRIGIEQRGSF